MLDKTTRMQLSSQAVFQMNGDQAKELLEAYSLPSRYLGSLTTANPGVCLLNIEGGTAPVYPVAVSPPCSDYKMSNTSFWKYCEKNNVEMIEE